jgi:hypothetical protein
MVWKGGGIRSSVHFPGASSANTDSYRCCCANRGSRRRFRQSCKRANPPRPHVVAWLFNFGFFGGLSARSILSRSGPPFRSEQFCTDVTRSARLSLLPRPERSVLIARVHNISCGRPLFRPGRIALIVCS